MPPQGCHKACHFPLVFFYCVNGPSFLLAVQFPIIRSRYNSHNQRRNFLITVVVSNGIHPVSTRGAVDALGHARRETWRVCILSWEGFRNITFFWA